MSNDPNQPPDGWQPPPYPQQGYPYHQPQPKGPGIGTGFKLVIGGCLALVVVVGGFFVACGVLVGGLSGINTNTPKSTTMPSSPSSSTPAPASKKITLAQYNQIKDGMKYAEVVAILGSEGKPVSENKIGSYKTEAFSWDAGTFASVSVILQNNKVMSKSQFGLE